MPQIQECSKCLNRSVCVMGEVDGAFYPSVREAIVRQIRLSPGDVLMHPGMSFEQLYLVRYGQFKSVLIDPDGRSHTTGLHGRGEVLGLEGLHKGQHHSEVTALQHASVCVIRYTAWCELIARIPSLQQAWLKALSRSASRDGQHMLLLSCMEGQVRVASFLLMLWERQAGASVDALELMMTRQEIGNFLGMTQESVSRHLSKFQQIGWIRMDRRRVKVLRLDALQNLRTPEPVKSVLRNFEFRNRMALRDRSVFGI